MGGTIPLGEEKSEKENVSLAAAASTPLFPDCGFNVTSCVKPPPPWLPHLVEVYLEL